MAAPCRRMKLTVQVGKPWVYARVPPCFGARRVPPENGSPRRACWLAFLFHEENPGGARPARDRRCCLFRRCKPPGRLRGDGFLCRWVRGGTQASSGDTLKKCLTSFTRVSKRECVNPTLRLRASLRAIGALSEPRPRTSPSPPPRKSSLRS